jgi:predicted dehydrogenase
MSGQIDIAVIGLGVMGRRMLARLAEHPRLRARTVWDASPAALEAARRDHPGLEAAADAAAAIAAPGLACLYIATPPGPHMALAEQAFERGLAVFCEKPLAVDFDHARRVIARIESERRRAAVNFSLASSPGLAAVEATLQDGSIGVPQRVEIEVAFAEWPRAWQAAAGSWLAERREGGFTREVLSHFVFVLQRALGQAMVEAARPDYPGDGRSAERGIEARLTAGGVPVTISGRVGGEVPDFNRMTLVGSKGAIELHDWFGLRRRDASGAAVAQGAPQDNRQRGQADQLDQLEAMIDGRPHTLPSFAEALAVQETIEGLLRGK